MAKRRWLSRVTGYNGGHDAFQGLRFPIFPGQPSRLAAAGNNNEINLISSRRGSTLHVLDPARYHLCPGIDFTKISPPLFFSFSLSFSFSLIDLTNPCIRVLSFLLTNHRKDYSSTRIFRRPRGNNADVTSCEERTCLVYSWEITSFQTLKSIFALKSRIKIFFVLYLFFEEITRTLRCRIKK